MSSDQDRCSFIPKRLCVHIFDASTLVIILMFQGTILNFYIIFNFSDSDTPYLLFIADFLCVFFYIGTLSASYTYLRTTYVDEDCEDGFSFRPKRMRLPPRSKFGVLPLSYASWLFYVAVLVTKICIIFKSSLIGKLSGKDHFGPQLLKVSMASSSFIFLLLVEGHNWAKRGTPRYSYVTTVCAKTGLEIFDSIAILSVLMDGPLALSNILKDVILGLASINLFLPALALYQLSLSDFAMSKVSLPLSVMYHVLHLAMVDVPYLGLRLYLWLSHRDRASMFLMKNILSIVLTVRGMYPDLWQVRQDSARSSVSHRHHQPKEAFEEVSLNTLPKDRPSEV